MKVETYIKVDTSQVGNTTYVGAFCHPDKDDTAVATAIDAADSMDEIRRLLENSNGFYTVLKRVTGGLIIGTDQINAYPVFFGQVDETLYVSDSQRWLLDHLEERTVDPTSVAEYRTASYVTGPNTLYEEISQTQAAELVEITSDGITRCTHFSFEFTETERKTFDDLDRILDRVFSRLIDQADGKQIWISLSGGLDSRLALLKLLEQGYEEVYTFTYGAHEEIPEATVAREVAESLEVPWRFIEYTDEKWNNCRNSYQLEAYESDFYLHTVPPVRPYLAISELNRDETVSDDAMIVNGASADFLAGSHIDQRILGKSIVSRRDAIRQLFNEHYRYNSYSNREYGLLQKRLKNTFKFNGGSGLDATEVLERWDWKERQTKFISTSSRYCEHFDFNWWMPFWDREFMEFWISTLIEQRIGKVFYDGYVFKKYSDISGGQLRKVRESELPLFERAKRRISNSTVGPILRPLYHSITPTKSAVEIWENDDLNQFSLLGKNYFMENFNGDEHIRSYRSQQHINRIKETDTRFSEV